MDQDTGHGKNEGIRQHGGSMTEAEDNIITVYMQQHGTDSTTKKRNLNETANSNN